MLGAFGDALGVGVEAFGVGEVDDGLAKFVEGSLVEFDEAGAFAKGVGAEAGEKTGGAAGGEDVGGPGEVVSGGDGGVRADEDGTGVLDAEGVAAGVAGGDLEVLGGKEVGECEGVVVGGGDEEGAGEFEGFAGELFARELFELGFNFCLYGLGEF